MKREEAAILFEIYERALHVLTEAEPVIFSLPKNDERNGLVSAHTNVIGKILSELRAPIVLKYPDLDTDIPDGPPDTLLDINQQEIVSLLTPLQIEAIDTAIIAECSYSWRKVARVVGFAMSHIQNSIPRVPDSYFAQRVVLLAKAGRIDSQGNLDYMRYSEIRLTSDCKNDSA